MATLPLSPELKQFLRKNINSIRQLELLIWLHANPSQIRNEREIARTLFCQPASVTKWLAGFEDQGLLATRNRKVMKELTAEYKTRPARIIRLVADGKKS